MMQVDRNRSFATAFSVDRTPQETFEAITNVRGWWSQEVEGVTDQVGGEFDYHYKDVHRCTIRVTELVPGRKVAWLVLDNYFNFIEDQAEWKNTEAVFEISEKDGGAEVHFTHVGLVPQYECYDVCSNAWGGYLGGSLRSLINTGKGQPNPKEDGNAPARSRGAIVNNVSMAAFGPLPVVPAYSISKAAAFSLTQSQRALLTAQGARVHAVLAGPTDTDMSREFDAPKASPESVARAIFDGVENQEEDIFPDSMSQTMAAGWQGSAAMALEREYAAIAAAERAKSYA